MKKDVVGVCQKKSQKGMALPIYLIEVAIRTICTIVCCRLLYNKLTKRKCIPIYGESWLNKYECGAMAVLIILLMTSSLTPIKSICKYIVTFNSCSWTTAKILVTFYRIRRLQYSFGAEQVHSKKYGYSKSWFFFLYMFGVGLFVAVFTTSVLKLMNQWKYTTNTYSCFSIGHEPTEQIFVSIFVGGYIIWDYTVLSCYIIKICQFYRKKSMDVPQIVINRVTFILQRIVFLTVIPEISTLFVGLTLEMWRYDALTYWCICDYF